MVLILSNLCLTAQVVRNAPRTPTSGPLASLLPPLVKNLAPVERTPLPWPLAVVGGSLAGRRGPKPSAPRNGQTSPVKPPLLAGASRPNSRRNAWVEGQAVSPTGGLFVTISLLT